MRASLACLVLASLLAGAAAPAAAVQLFGRRDSRSVSFVADDGVALAATWYEPSRRPAPAVILLHMLNRSKRDWDTLASRLASAGIGALAIDLRGHGESRLRGTPADDAGYAAMLRDVRAAQRFLLSRGDVLPGRIGLLGASLGANLALLHAAEGGVPSLALLSPSLDYRGLRIDGAARKYGGKPMLLVASDDDPYARRSALELQKAAGGRQLLTLSGAGHGTNMLLRAPELHQALVDWFVRTLE
ncbi:MAG TPA: alpha/beta fold hydrolase [Vicinamibacterales bacterium]|nr:alpha/beta fold hydrolase [Vicinamibacterales bacterium]